MTLRFMSREAPKLRQTAVYPVAALVHEIPHYAKAYYIDPQADHSRVPPQYKLLNMTATEGMHELFHQLTN